jgi:hypothetical protein
LDVSDCKLSIEKIEKSKYTTEDFWILNNEKILSTKYFECLYDINKDLPISLVDELLKFSNKGIQNGFHNKDNIKKDIENFKKQKNVPIK